MATTRSQLLTRIAALSVRAATLARTTDDPARRGVLFEAVAALGAAGRSVDRAADEDALAAIDAVLGTLTARLADLEPGRPLPRPGD